MSGRFTLRALAVLALAAGLATPAMAQSSATASASATTRIITPITLTKTADLAFGNVVRPSTGSGTVTIGSGADTIAVTGTGAAAASGTTSRAKFTVGGEGGQTFSITVPASVTMTSGGNNLVVTLSSAAATGTISGSLGTPGTATVNVGGSFPITNTTVSGNYTGNFNVTVAYN
ncbi:MAG: DUF4402 domain-containing protein [Alphaproteobacteria bacterium]|nr:DUF4402 domain-containing protein [Alphaproteobacteria bacterium]